MVRVVVAEPHEFVTVYEMVAVPNDIPVTTPADVTVATEVVPLAHVPPATEAPSVIVWPRHTFMLPVMVAATGNGFTVTGWVAAAEPQTVVTV